MTEYAGGQEQTATLVAPLPGRSDSLLATRSALGRRFVGLTDFDTSSLADGHTDVAPAAGPGASGTEIVGAIETALNTGEDWFDKVHIFPGVTTLNTDYLEEYKIDYGNILGDVDRTYEIFNAHRRDTQTLSAIDLSEVSPGITTPDIAITDTVGALTSLLDSTSTYNTDGVTGLGTPVTPTVRALDDGVPTFDGNAVFTFGIGSVDLPLKGARIALSVPEYESPVTETMSFLTDVITSTDGKEQRISLRKEPREGIIVTYRLESADRQRMQAVLLDWQASNFGVPLWHQYVRLSATSAIGANQWQVTNADSVDFRVGGLALLYTDAFTLEIATISAATDTLITVDTNNTYEHPAGTRVIPVRVSRLVKFPRGLRRYVDMEDFIVSYEFTDNNTGVPAASSTAWNSNTHDGRILLDDCNIMRGTLPESYDRDITVIDGGTGIVSQASGWEKNKHTWVKGFSAHSQTEILNLKALLRYLRGKQKAFWMPTKTEDLTAGAALIATSQILDIENIDYIRYVQNRGPKNVIRVTYNDGNPDEIKEITSSAAHPTDSTLERLTVDSGWANSQALDTIDRIEFLELVRLDADNFNIRHERIGTATLTVPVRVVFDDD